MFNRFRFLLKTWLRSLPFGVGVNILQPLVVAALNFKPWRRWGKLLVCEIEGRKIRSEIAKGKKEFVIVFDDAVSALAFGELTHLVMVGRYLLTHSCNLKIFIITATDEQVYFANYLNTVPVQSFFKERNNLMHELLDSECVSIEFLTWELYRRRFDDLHGHAYFVLANRVARRLSIYNYSFNLLNVLMRSTPNQIQEAFLLKRRTECWRQFLKTNDLQYLQSYIVLGCRYNQNWRSSANFTAEDFSAILFILREKYPEKSVVIVSDSTGCDYFRELSHSHGFDCYFSVDIYPGFWGSVQLVLGADLFIQVNGGGIGVAAIYSKVPYFICGVPANELMYAKEKIACWATHEQVFINTPILSKQKLISFLQ